MFSTTSAQQTQMPTGAEVTETVNQFVCFSFTGAGAVQKQTVELFIQCTHKKGGQLVKRGAIFAECEEKSAFH